MTPLTAKVDVAFVGGGVAALWLARLAERRGLSVAVIAPEPLGGEQTMASQGIIHSGGKYQLRRNLPRRLASDSLAHLATMPVRWRRCLAGNIVETTGDVDLRGVPVLAEHVELCAATRWSLPRFRLASKLLSAPPRREGVSPSLRAARRVDNGTVPRHKSRVRLSDDFVVEVEGLVQQLSTCLQGFVLPHKVAPDDVLVNNDGVTGIRAGNTALRAQHYVFAAGAGNAELAPRAGFDEQTTVLRPLHQAWARIERAEPTYAHYLTRPFGVEPDLTVTTHQHGNATILYLGGHLATAGVARSERTQTEAAQRALAAALPHIDTALAEFHTLRVDRAEPRRPVTQRASDAYLTTRRNVSLCFPIKLSLMPRLGDLFLHELANVKPIPNPWRGDPSQPIAIARRPWA